MITREILDQVAATVRSNSPDEGCIAGLRKQFGTLHFTYCMDDDIPYGLRPVVSEPGFKLYLVDGRGHCMSFTSQAEYATGLVVAECDSDSDSEEEAP